MFLRLEPHLSPLRLCLHLLSPGNTQLFSPPSLSSWPVPDSERRREMQREARSLPTFSLSFRSQIPSHSLLCLASSVSSDALFLPLLCYFAVHSSSSPSAPLKGSASGGGGRDDVREEERQSQERRRSGSGSGKKKERMTCAASARRLDSPIVHCIIAPSLLCPADCEAGTTRRGESESCCE